MTFKPHPSEPRKVRLDTKRGVGARRQYIYATLYDATTGTIMISATLDYVKQAIEERGYRVVEERHAEITQFTPQPH